MRIPTPLTPEQRKRVIAEYVATGNYTETARRTGLSTAGVRKIVLSHQSDVKECIDKKEQEVSDIFAFLDKRKTLVCDILDGFLQAMADKVKQGNARLSELTTAFGTLMDKYTIVQDYITDNRNKNNTLVVRFEDMTTADKDKSNE